MDTSYTNKSIKVAKRFVNKRINCISVFNVDERGLFQSKSLQYRLFLLNCNR